MANVAILVLVWVLAFAIFFVPARSIGGWLARRMSPGAGLLDEALNILICLIVAKLVVVIGGVVLIFGRFDIFPRVNDGPQRSGLFFAAVLLFLPAFAALVTGYLQARNLAKRS